MPPSHQPKAPNPVVISGWSAQLPPGSVVVVVAKVVVEVPGELDVDTGTEIVVGTSVVVEAIDDVVNPGNDVVASPASPGLQAVNTKANSGRSFRITAKLTNRGGEPERFEFGAGMRDQSG